MTNDNLFYQFIACMNKNNQRTYTDVINWGITWILANILHILTRPILERWHDQIQHRSWCLVRHCLLHQGIFTSLNLSRHSLYIISISNIISVWQWRNICKWKHAELDFAWIFLFIITIDVCLNTIDDFLLSLNSCGFDSILAYFQWAKRGTRKKKLSYEWEFQMGISFFSQEIADVDIIADALIPSSPDYVNEANQYLYDWRRSILSYCVHNQRAIVCTWYNNKYRF